MLGLALLVALAITVVGRRLRSTLPGSPWDIAQVATTYTGILGLLAGFIAAAAIFVAGLSGQASAPELPTMLAMYLTAFIGLIAASHMFGTLPNLVNPKATDPTVDPAAAVQRLGFILSFVCYYLGIALSWLGIQPLLLVLGQRQLSALFALSSLVVVVAGMGRLAMFLYTLTPISGSACLAMPVIGTGVAFFYRLATLRWIPQLWPQGDAPVQLAVVSFGIITVAFAAETALLALGSNNWLRNRLWDVGMRLLLAYVQIVVTVVTLLWFAMLPS
jgi:hypothetical protein